MHAGRPQAEPKLMFTDAYNAHLLAGERSRELIEQARRHRLAQLARRARREARRSGAGVDPPPAEPAVTLREKVDADRRYAMTR